MKTYLITPQKELNGFVHKSDYDFFNRPIEVFVFACSLGSRKHHLLYVEEVRRHERYPVTPAHLTWEYQLTRKQRISAY